MNINTVIKEELRKQGMTQKLLAEKLHMHTSTLCRKLNGSRTLYVDEFASICNIMGISADDILEEADAYICFKS